MDNFIGKVHAQSAPTFQYEGPFEQPETPEPGPDPSTDNAQVKLTATSSSIQIGSTATCDLDIESSDREIKSYSINITFDPSVLEVVDSVPSQTGTQINFVDQFSTASYNSANNSEGNISITASITGSAQTINRRIAQITFRAKSSGTSIVSINKSQSSVKTDNEENVIGSTTSVNFSVTGQTVTTTSPISSTTTTTSPSQLPDSGIFDTLAALGSILAGLLMLFVGVKTVFIKKKSQEFDL